MSHRHAEEHDHRHNNRKRLLLALTLAITYMLAEVIAGLIANSLALLADAGHMLSDAAALGLTLFAMWIARRPPSAEKTYGYYRAEILAALANGATLVAVAIYIFIEAYHRLREPPHVMGGTMMVVAIGGLVINVAMMLILHSAREESLNIKGAWLHVLGDAAGSVGAIVAGVLIWSLGWNWADPVASLLIGLLILFSSWRLLQETVAILMEGSPGHIDVDEVRNHIRSIPGVLDVHDLHVWTITSGLEALSAHVRVQAPSFSPSLLHGIRTSLGKQFKIDHITIQLEPEEFDERPTPV
jgi:cobalt-zinc-cadmium efflux system protein